MHCYSGDDHRTRYREAGMVSNSESPCEGFPRELESCGAQPGLDVAVYSHASESVKSHELSVKSLQSSRFVC